jgi:hypothetical protein
MLVQLQRYLQVLVHKTLPISNALASALSTGRRLTQFSTKGFNPKVNNMNAMTLFVTIDGTTISLAISTIHYQMPS